jgi:hypothetical protein
VFAVVFVLFTVSVLLANVTALGRVTVILPPVALQNIILSEFTTEYGLSAKTFDTVFSRIDPCD